MEITPPGVMTDTSVIAHVAHTPNHINCPACERYRGRFIEPEAFSRLLFTKAAPIWLEEHKADVTERTYRSYQDYLKPLLKWFGEIPLLEIRIWHVEAYREARAVEWTVEDNDGTPRSQWKGAGPSLINHEVNTLMQILDRGGLRREIARHYKPLKLGKSKVGRALEPHEEERLFVVASSNRRWRVAYWCAIVTAATTAGEEEITHLHLGDIDLSKRTLRIRDGLKNEHRDRFSYLNDSAMWAIGNILKRYYKLCRRFRIQPDPEHYVLWGRPRNGHYSPWMPMGSWRKAWQKIREKADLPDLRYYDLRHHAHTKLTEAPDLTDTAIIEQTGHRDRKMELRYTHARMEAKKRVAEKLEVKIPAQPAYNLDLSVVGGGSAVGEK